MMTLNAPEVQNLKTSPVRPVDVLVVEDDADLRHAIVEVFLMKGFQVNAAGNGLDAVELAFRHPYDVIVSDIRLPGMDGLGVLQSLRTFPRKTRIILMTAYPDWKVFHEAQDMGAVEILRKPFSLARLAEAVERAAREGSDELQGGEQAPG
jgi:DNA-binding NtrC family response regulator